MFTCLFIKFYNITYYDIIGRKSVPICTCVFVFDIKFLKEYHLGGQKCNVLVEMGVKQHFGKP